MKILQRLVLLMIAITSTVGVNAQNNNTSGKSGVIRKQVPLTYPKKSILYLVSNTATLKGIPVGFFAEELTRPYFDFIQAGYEVDLVSPKGGKVAFDAYSDPENSQGAYPNDLISIGFKHHKEFGKLMDNTKSIEGINIDKYDAIVVAGGGAPLLTFKDDVKLHKLVADFYEKGKVVTLICHGTSLLLWTKLSNGELLANGKTWTGFADSEEKSVNETFKMKVNDYTIETEAAKNKKTRFEAREAWQPFAIRDGRLITAQQQHSSLLVSGLVIEALSK